MIGITVKHLRYFDALAQCKHFGRAADACSISQPAMSLQIKELETMLGSPLVERASRQLELTALGEVFWERAQEILAQVDNLSDLVRGSDDPPAGRLRIGIIPTMAPYLLPNTIVALQNRFPELDLQPRETVTNSLIDDLKNARLDAAIVALPISEPTLQEFLLFEEDFVLVRSSNDEDKPIPAPNELKEMRLLLLEEGHCFRDQALAFCDISRDSQRYLMEGSSLSTLVQMVGAGIGLTLLPEMAIPLETNSAKVSVARFPEPAPRRTVGMVWRKRNPLAKQLMKIAAVIRSV